MNHRERFLEIKNFLKPYQKIWENEIMLQYPSPLDGYNTEWIEDLRRFQSKSDVIRLEKKDVFELIKNPSLINFYQEIKKLTFLPQLAPLPPIKEDAFTWLFMVPKKQHEIKKLAPHINHLFSTYKIKNILDIGGGIGLLAQTLNNYYQLPVISIDMNPLLQETGRLRHEKNAKDPLNKVIYKNLKFSSEPEFKELLKPNVMTIGLHTCGRLAIDLIQMSSLQKVPVLVNFGCCYHTLDSHSKLQNISHFAQENNPLWMNRFALTLSCRAHQKMDEKDYDLKIKVKRYRYAIHILFYDHYDLKTPVTLGNSSPKLYDRPFSDYALEQMARINLTTKHSPKELDEFFHDPRLELLIQKMLAAGLIRNALGRVLEVYLMLDRVIFLEEKGYRVQLQEFFHEEESPRNIGITAILEK